VHVWPYYIPYYHIHASFVLSFLTIVCGRQANANAWTLLMHYVVYCNRKIKSHIGVKAQVCCIMLSISEYKENWRRGKETKGADYTELLFDYNGRCCAVCVYT
jgi:hypothetical protein